MSPLRKSLFDKRLLGLGGLRLAMEVWTRRVKGGEETAGLEGSVVGTTSFVEKKEVRK